MAMQFITVAICELYCGIFLKILNGLLRQNSINITYFHYIIVAKYYISTSANSAIQDQTVIVECLILLSFIIFYIFVCTSKHTYVSCGIFHKKLSSLLRQKYINITYFYKIIVVKYYISTYYNTKASTFTCCTEYNMFKIIWQA